MCAVQGGIASWGEMRIETKKIGTEKQKSVVDELEICAKAHEIGAIETNLWSR
jgi:hypothetical protein